MERFRLNVFCAAALFFAFGVVSSSKKILLLTGPIHSHQLQIGAIIGPLVKRGHDVYMICDSHMDLPSNIEKNKLNIIWYASDTFPDFQSKSHQQSLFDFASSEFSLFKHKEMLTSNMELFRRTCDSIVQNEKLKEQLKGEKFDFVVIDGLFRCLFGIANMLETPWASLGAFHFFDTPIMAAQGPLLVTSALDGVHKENTVFNRLCRILFATLFGYLGRFEWREISPDHPFDSVKDVMLNTSLWFYDISAVLDLSIPIAPNVIKVGGLTTKKPEPLSEGPLKEFLDSAERGFVLASFGSIATLFPEHLVRTLIGAFGKLSLKVVFKCDPNLFPSNLEVPKNVLLMNWLPQNDILGHKNIKVFITHGGNNGQHEALYNAVPSVSMPVFADQIFNGERFERMGFGRLVLLKDVTEERLLSAIGEILSNKTFKENIEKASRIFKDQLMTPRETAVYWIEHVMKYGDRHLKNQYANMPWYQILLLDVVALVLLVFFVLMFLICCTCRFLCPLCCRRNTKIKEKTS